MAFEKFKELTNSGFGSNATNEGERLITKNGTFNVKKEGASFLERFNLFHWLINMPGLTFFFSLLLGFILINLVFTAIYLLVGIEGLQGTSGDNDFFDAFYFSAQTLTTVGYGALHPTGKMIGMVASIEAFVGLLSFAVSTGLLYGRFSKPKSKLLFSKNALISPYKEMTGLMIRVANPKNNQLINAEAKMIYSQIETENGVKTRRFYILDLEMTKISLFATSWTIVHPITDDSPLKNLHLSDMHERNAELILLLSAYDESYSQSMHARTSYKSSEIVENVKFVSVIDFSEGRQPIIRLDKINDYEHVN